MRWTMLLAALELGYIESRSKPSQNLARTVKYKIGWCAPLHKTASSSAYRASCRIAAAAATMFAGSAITSDTNVDVLVKLAVAPVL